MRIRTLWNIILFLNLLLSPCVYSNEISSSIPHIEIPRKVAKRVHLVKEKLDKKSLSMMPAFAQLSKAIEDEKAQVDQEVISAALAELDAACFVAQKKMGSEAESLKLYVSKIKHDLSNAPIIMVTRQCPITTAITTIGSSCLSQGACAATASVCARPSAAAPSVLGQTVSGNTNFTGQVDITDSTDSVDVFTGALVVNGGLGVAQNLNIGGLEHVINTTDSTNCANGALVVDGGVGIGRSLNVCGPVQINNRVKITAGNTPSCQGSNNNESTSCDTGALVIDGGIGIGKNANICGQVTIHNTTTSGYCNSGALTVAGGVGIGGNVNACGIVHIYNTTNTANTNQCNAGALVVDGGVGIGQNLNVCGNTTLNGTLLVEQGATINEYLDVYGPLNVEGPINTTYYITINGGTVIATNPANCNLSIGDNTDPVSNGTDNTAVGESAMQNNQIGINNTAVGCRALQLDTKGNDNTALGNQALQNLNGSLNNTAVGSEASYNTRDVDNTTAVGFMLSFLIKQMKILL